MLGRFLVAMMLFSPLPAASATHETLSPRSTRAFSDPSWNCAIDDLYVRTNELAGCGSPRPASTDAETLPRWRSAPLAATVPAAAVMSLSLANQEAPSGLTSIGLSQVQFASLVALLTFTMFGSASYVLVRLYPDRSARTQRSQRVDATDEQPSAGDSVNLLSYASTELASCYQLVSKIARGAPLQTVLNRELEASRKQLELVRTGLTGAKPALSGEQMHSLLLWNIKEIRRVATVAEAAFAAMSSDPALGSAGASKLEAFAFLGVHADANPSALKKTIDGLRQCWHPDLAVNDEDRKVREVRIRQINVAWQLISEKRAGEREPDHATRALSISR